MSRKLVVWIPELADTLNRKISEKAERYVLDHLLRSACRIHCQMPILMFRGLMISHQSPVFPYYATVVF